MTCGKYVICMYYQSETSDVTFFLD
jgi:hypothetical protein